MALTAEVAHMALNAAQARLEAAAPGRDPAQVIDLQHRINQLRTRTNDMEDHRA